MVIRGFILKAAATLTDNTDSRYFLQSVQVRPDGEVAATNGHVAVIVKDKYAIPDADFPVSAGGFDGELKTPLLVAVDGVKRLLAGMAKKATIPVLRAARFGYNGERQVGQATDLSSHVTVDVQRDGADANYPNLARVFPTEEQVQERNAVTLRLSVEVLKSLLDLASGLSESSRKKNQAIRFEIPTNDASLNQGKDGELVDRQILVAVPFFIENGDVEARGVAMPMRG